MVYVMRVPDSLKFGTYSKMTMVGSFILLLFGVANMRKQFSDRSPQLRADLQEVLRRGLMAQNARAPLGDIEEMAGLAEIPLEVWQQVHFSRVVFIPLFYFFGCPRRWIKEWRRM